MNDRGKGAGGRPTGGKAPGGKAPGSRPPRGAGPGKGAAGKPPAKGATGKGAAANGPSKRSEWAPDKRSDRRAEGGAGKGPGKGFGRGGDKPAGKGFARGGAKAASARKAGEGASRSPRAAASAPATPKVAEVRKPATAVSTATLDVRQFRVAADDDGIRLDRWFKRHLPDISFAQVSRWARTGQLRVDGARATPGDRVTEGQGIRVPPADPKPAASETVRVKKVKERPVLSDEELAHAQGMVIHIDAQAIVINKPPGLATQGGTKTEHHVDGLLDALMYDLDQRPKLVHRLDKDTSGALLLARTSRSAGHFAKAFSSRTARKVYWALVMGVPSIADGMIELPLAKQPGTGGEKMHVDEEEGLPARTRYRIIERAGNRAAWVELQPYTGRTHQLRVHMAAIGHPIVGDGKYGGKEAFLSGTISRKMHLHARRIRIDSPEGGVVDVKADLPRHFDESLKDLGFDMTLGDMPLVEDLDLRPTREDDKKLARQHAKLIRKERRGERRGRGSR
ncbi:RluA family pseudouridine synthase [Sphingobium sp. H39-3-25]|uniref:RluA family pseudouridine synthase n=1 Tax=Sphingobium arseniciresistens TaxID=3030834 RepID=UPI0023B9132B|nr:RluA family pseudouridine synthase [Sphingobium arseniciresistens]